MTLLRAAELAREAGKSHFHVVGRNDYQRYLTQTMNGVPMNRTLTGYKTETDHPPAGRRRKPTRSTPSP